MSKSPIVLVLGAGAGCDLGMPLGSGLQQSISDYSAVARDADIHGRNKISDGRLAAALNQLWRDKHPQPFVDALKHIHDGIFLRASIDDFLDRHRSNQTMNIVGKMLIARAILHHERQSNLHFSRENTYNRLEIGRIRDSWLIRFWQMLGRGTSTEEIAESLDHITIINFNYDRCLEHFLIQAFRNLDNWDEDRAREFIYSRVKIFHPYGTLGELPTNGRGGIGFGDESANLINAAGRIKTYTEQVDDEKLIDAMRSEIQRAQTLIFLGFHFHDQNIRLIAPSRPATVSQVYSTVYGISVHDQAVIRSKINSLVDYDITKSTHVNRLQLVDGDCAELFRRYEKTLQF